MRGETSLCLWGAPGRGKTHASAAATRARLEWEAVKLSDTEDHDKGVFDPSAVDYGKRVKWTTAAELINTVRDLAFGERMSVDLALAPYRHASWLCVDDLGATAREELTAYAADLLFGIFDSRYGTERPTLVTSNVSPDGLAEMFGAHGERLAGRIEESYVLAELAGKDWRS